jgi:hypothetical protein
LNRKITVLIVLIVIVLGMALVIRYVPPSSLSVESVSESVPIQLGYNVPQSYWILTASLDETINFKLVLSSGSNATVDPTLGTYAYAKSEVSVCFQPVVAYSETAMYPANLTYTTEYYPSLSWPPVTVQSKDSPAYTINGAGWLTTLSYNVQVYKNGVMLGVNQAIQANYKQNQMIQLSTGSGNPQITLFNQGQLSQGVSPPAGDWVLVYDPSGVYHVFDRADFINMLTYFDSNGVKTQHAYYYWTWSEVWSWCQANGCLPPDEKSWFTNVVNWEIPKDNHDLTITYPFNAFSELISLYVPSSLADTVIIQENDPIPKIVSVIPSSINNLKSGYYTYVTVQVQDIGTDGDIAVSLTDPNNYFSFAPATSNAGGGFFKANQTESMSWKATALAVGQSGASGTINVLAQGRGGTATATISYQITYNSHYGQSGYSGYNSTSGGPPPPPTPPSPPWWQQWWVWAIVSGVVAVVAVIAVVAIKRRKHA